MTCTVEQAEKWFREDTAEAVSAVAKIPCKLTPAMADALVSLAYNAGEAVAPSNTIYVELSKSPPEYYNAWAWFSKWRKQTGKDLLGLARRRAEEMVLFLEDGLPR
jgi:GH24 family phage-related lysozyme (muramidase)